MKSWSVPRPTGPIMVGAGPTMLVKAIVFNVVTSAVVGNRRIAVVVRDANGDTKQIIMSNVDQTASTDVGYSFGTNTSTSSFVGATNVVTASMMSNLTLEPGDTLDFGDLGAISSADVIRNIVVGYETAWWG